MSIKCQRKEKRDTEQMFIKMTLFRSGSFNWTSTKERTGCPERWGHGAVEEDVSGSTATKEATLSSRRSTLRT